MRASIASALLAVCVSAACDAVPTSASEPCDDTVGQEVMRLINQERADQGLPALTVDLRLVDAARGHSQDMASNGFVGHTGADGSNAGARIDRAGYSWSYYAENVAAGQPSAASVVEAWMGSSGHRSNILASGATHLGIGYVNQSGTEYGHYWTVNFGSTQTDAAAPADGCHP